MTDPMTFANPEMLFLIWTLPVLLALYLYGRRKRRRILHDFADPEAMHLLVPPGIVARRRLRAILVLSAASLLVVAMSGPQAGFEWQEVERRGVDLVIALDCSRSMLAEDIQPSRLARAKRELIDLLGMLQGDRVGLVAYSGTAFLQCPLTLDYAAFDLFLNVLTPDYLPVGGTDLTAAVRTSIAAFDPESPADKAIILITDGEHTGRGDPQEAAEAAREAGIKLFCIGVGAADGVPVPAARGGFKKDADGRIVLTRLDEVVLTRLAVTTGGAYVRSVAGDMDLETVYRDHIRGGMEQATLESGRQRVWADRYQWPLCAAILLLIVAEAVPAVKKPLVALFWTAAVLMPAIQAHAGPLQDGYRAYHQGDYEEARRQYVRGQLQDPQNSEILYNLGNAYYKTGDYEAAGTHYRQALSQASPELKAKLLYNLGNTAYRLGALPEAVSNYKAALELAPDDTQARENLDFVEKQLQQDRRRQEQSSNGRGDSRESAQDQADRQEGEDPPQPGENRASAGRPPRAQAQTPPDGPQSVPEAGSSDHDGADGGEPAGAAPRPAPDSARPEGGRRQMAPAAADHMLNRLKDQPGRAMMPAYGKQTVEKDW